MVVHLLHLSKVRRGWGILHWHRQHTSLSASLLDSDGQDVEPAVLECARVR